MKKGINLAIVLAALVAIGRAGEAKTEEVSYHEDPYSGDVVACDDYGCELVHTANADVHPQKVGVDLEGGLLTHPNN